MASLLFDRESKRYFVRFRYGGRSFKRSLGTGNEKLARAQAGRIEETLLLLKHGRLAVPAAADPVAFILSDGRKLADLDYPKRDEKQPFMTWDKIEQIIQREALSPADAKRYWECLYLRGDEVQAALAYLREHAVHDYVYPLTLLIAHTGVRLSEAIRSRREDIDLESGNILVREKKRSRTRAITFRRVELTVTVQAELREWLARDQGGANTFARPWDSRRLCEPGPAQPLDPDTAHDHFKLSFKGSKWANIRGFHVFRHSFASNLAAAGVDQRIIDEWMGHQTDEMRCRYRHLLPETKKAAIAKLFAGSPLRLYGT